VEGGGQAVEAPATVTTPPSSAEEGQKRMAEMKKAMQAGASQVGAQAAKSIIPVKYGNAETSGLSFTVQSDASKNDFTIPLTE
jgi:hypothetical protein